MHPAYFGLPLALILPVRGARLVAWVGRLAARTEVGVSSSLVALVGSESGRLHTGFAFGLVRRLRTDAARWTLARSLTLGEHSSGGHIVGRSDSRDGGGGG